MNKIHLFITAFFSLLILNIVHASELKKNLLIDVELSPIGSFQIESKRFKGGKIIKTGNTFIVENIYVPSKTLKSGMDLRDTHVRKRLLNENIVVLSASGKDGEGSGKIIVRNIEHIFKFKYEILSESFLNAKFSLSLENFKVPDLSYMGITVKDNVSVSVTLPYATK